MALGVPRPDEAPSPSWDDESVAPDNFLPYEKPPTGLASPAGMFAAITDRPQSPAIVAGEGAGSPENAVSQLTAEVMARRGGSAASDRDAHLMQPQLMLDPAMLQHLRPSTMLSPSFGSRKFQKGAGLLGAQRLRDACEVFLVGLVRAPDDEFMDRGFRAGHERYKYFQPSRWSRWPFHPIIDEEDHAAQVNEPPGGMPPTTLVTVTQNSIEVEWPEYEIRPDVERDAADGYHLDTAPLCPIDGPHDNWEEKAQWTRAYKGKKLTYNIRGLSLSRDVLVRVRAYNSKGGGEWSAIRRYRVEPPPPPVLVEHKDIPTAWRSIDIGDVIKEEKLVEDTDEFNVTMRGLFASLHSHRTTIKVAFRYYSIVGSSASKDEESDSMTMQQFLGCTKGAKFLEESSLITSDIDRIYMRSIRDLGNRVSYTSGAPAAAPAMAPAAAPASAPDAAAPAAAQGDKDKEWAKTRGAVKAVGAIKTKSKGNVMCQPHFVGGLIRVANATYATQLQDVTARVDKLIGEILAPHVNDELDLLHDAFSHLMGKQPMLAVFSRRRLECERVFWFYAAADKSLGAAKATTTMNMAELSYLMEDTKCFDSKFGVRQLVDAFVRVNIEDDVYIQADKANTSTELVFEEFFEVLARMYYAREGGPRNRKPSVKLLLESGEDGLELARGFDAWLQVGFLPAAFDAIKTRKKAKSG